MEKTNINLFVYGSLRDASIFRSVCGLSYTLKPGEAGQGVLRAELALLSGYKKVSPDNIYAYAIEYPNARIEGYVIYDMPPQTMAEIDKYEGKLYDRDSVTVNTAGGPVAAKAYLASHKSMKKRFGDRFHVNLIHELWLRKRIENFFDTHTRPGEKTLDADVERRARRELLGTTERDLVVSHLGHEAVSDFYLEHELDRPVPSIRGLYGQQDSALYMNNYITLVIKQALLNQFEYILQTRFRYELERLMVSRRYYTRTTSLLIAFWMLNGNPEHPGAIIGRGLETMPACEKYDLMDYVKYAIHAADNIFDSRVAKSQIERLRNSRQKGLIPMGAELEFSNIGFRAVGPDSAPGRDGDFDGFFYFRDFCLDVLTWRMGGYVDDHSGAVKQRQRGFLELAPGRLNIAGEVSKPITDDPWIMNQLIQEATVFYPVRPHSLHLSFQIRRKHIDKQKMLPLEFVQCLLALGGGTQLGANGKLWVSRMGHDEIRRHIYGEELVFTRTSKRKFFLQEDQPSSRLAFQPTVYVQQYKFIRLEPRANYEPLVMALKGLQLAYHPADYLTAKQLSENPQLQEEYRQLKDWAVNPGGIDKRTRDKFLSVIHDGLLIEAHKKPAHDLHYIDWAVGAVDIQLQLFNKQVKNNLQDPDFITNG